MNSKRFTNYTVIFSCLMVGILGKVSMAQGSNDEILKGITEIVDESKHLRIHLADYPEGLSELESVISLGDLLARSSVTDIITAVLNVKDDAKSKTALKIGLEQIEPVKYLNVLSSIIEIEKLTDDEKISFLRSPDLYRHLITDNWSHPKVIKLIGLAKENISNPEFLSWLSKVESGVAKERIDEYRAAVGGPATVIKIPESDDLGGTATKSDQESEEAAVPGNPESSRVDLVVESTTKAEKVESPTLPKWAFVLIVVAVLGILILLIRAFLRSRGA